jgi:hypothetical protein
MDDQMGFIGWEMDRAQRDALLQHYPPHYERTVADHVTLKFGTAKDVQPPREAVAEIVGFVDDGEGVQAAVVEIDGTTHRPDGSTYHITWSLGDGREAKESNDVIAARGWTALAAPVKVTLHPRRWP